MPLKLDLVWPLGQFLLMRQDVLEMRLVWLTAAIMVLEHSTVIIHEMLDFDVESVSMYTHLILTLRLYIMIGRVCILLDITLFLIPQLNVQMVMLGWLEEHLTIKAVWSSALMKDGELFAVVLRGTPLMLKLYAGN